MKKYPNIVYVLTDDQGYGDLACTGNPYLRTPNIDNLYNESSRLTNFHVGPTCAPTRAGLMTGHYANSTGVWHTIGGRSLLRKNEWTLGNALQENGYSTGIFGKWHLGDVYPYRPMDRGFETSIIHGGGGISQVPDWWGNDYFDDTYLVNGEPKAFKGYCTDVFFDEAKSYISAHKDEPFFCYIACNAPHSPYNVEDKYANHYRGDVPEHRARFYGMIENIDENIGKLRQHLVDLNLAENTIFIFMTDNGTSAGISTDEQGFVIDGYNMGMRGGKCSEYDGGHRVPFFIHWPEGGLTEAKDYPQVTANVDFLPTILDLCGINVPENRSFHGISLKPLLDNQDLDLSDRAIVTDSQRVTRPVKWRKSAVCSSQWRLINRDELYDINQDPEQRNDIAKDHPEIVASLRVVYEDWWTKVSDNIDEPMPISIVKQANKITTHDMINPMSHTVWNQGQVRTGHKCAGHYDIEVDESGTYKIELRRWDRILDLPINSHITKDVDIADDYIQESDLYLYRGSEALNIGYASLRIQDQDFYEIVTDDATCVQFEVKLKQGFTKLEALFIAKIDEYVLAPYYIYVEAID